MKKGVVFAIIALFSLSIAGTALAEPAGTVNPFVDVPAKHWAYGAISQLQKAGIIDGYGDKTFRGDNTLTRYEMAVLVARAMSRSEMADKKNQETIEKLQKEFALELKKMGIRIAALEKKTDNAFWTGEARTRYSHDGKKDGTGQNRASTVLEERARLYIKGQINPGWAFIGRFETTQDLRQSSSSTASGTTNLNLSYVEGPVGQLKVSAGRVPYIPAYGLMADSVYNGVQVDFGKIGDLGVRAFYGRESKTGQVSDGAKKYIVSNDIYAPTAKQDTDLRGVELSVANGGTNVKGAYLEYTGQNATISKTTPAAKMWELGFDTKLAADWTLKAVVGKSNAQTQNNARVIGLAYKSYDIRKANSYNYYIDYRNLERLATFNSTYNVDSIGNIVGGKNIHGVKGIEFGMNYVLDKNILLKALYLKGEATDDTKYADDLFRLQVYMYF
ncbi:MAG TPA: S-layer homology domain-containing protein [Negativicutes bacterium]|nr:S-layer homology domain-containing protein [Negativicutes bacterium]